jgi:hypothetical protein
MTARGEPIKDWERAALAEQRRARWDEILKGVKEGRHPTQNQLAYAISRCGIEPHSDAAKYVIGRLNGNISRPKGRPKFDNRQPDWVIRLQYQSERLYLTALRDQRPQEYRRTYKNAQPAVEAKRAMAKALGISVSRLERILYQSRKK